MSSSVVLGGNAEARLVAHGYGSNGRLPGPGAPPLALTIVLRISSIEWISPSPAYDRCLRAEIHRLWPPTLMFGVVQGRQHLWEGQPVVHNNLFWSRVTW